VSKVIIGCTRTDKIEEKENGLVVSARKDYGR